MNAEPSASTTPYLLEEEEEDLSSKIRIVDQHCHLLPESSREFSRDFFIRVISLESYNPDYVIHRSVLDHYLRAAGEEERAVLVRRYGIGKIIENAERSGESTLLFKEVLREFAGFFGCRKDVKAVLDSRNQRAADDYNAYVKQMFSAARIETLILSDYPSLPYTDQSRFPAAVLKNKLVLPSLIFDCVEASKTFEETENKFIETINEYLGKRGFVGIKSMIAYGGERRGSGLDIGNPGTRDAAREFMLYKDRKGKVEGPQIKNLQDYFHRIAVKEAMKSDRPFEFHTGIGDTEIVAEKCNPMLLVNMLKDEEIRRANVVLLHTGYPYVAEAGWMAHFFPNVYLDSSIIFFTHFAAAVRRMGEALEMTPYSKLLYSSDGMIPELQWFTARFAKRVLSSVLENLIEAKTLDEGEALELAESYFHGNAERLYAMV